MNPIPTEQWIDQQLPLHERLTQAAITITTNLLRSKNIEHLAVTGRTKNKQASLDKIKRKGYKDLAAQLTDISGIRIIVYFESDLQKVVNLLEASFSVDKANSLNRDDLLSTNQIGYRSIHLVCDLGKQRGDLPEFYGLGNLKFEFQIRTVLQHAWAELAHDRNYKFAGKLPREVERKLYLYAGVLEIADKGFDEISNEIDKYIESVHERSAKGDLSTEINSLSLEQFIEDWCETNNFPLEDVKNKDNYGDLVRELKEFGITSLEELSKIVPIEFSSKAKAVGYSTNIYGLIRDWLLIFDWRRFIKEVKFNWILSDKENMFHHYFDEKEYKHFSAAFEWMDDPEDL